MSSVYTKRSRFPRWLLVLTMLAVVAGGLWWKYGGDDGGIVIPPPSLSPQGMIGKWKAELDSGKGKSVADEITAALASGTVKADPEVLWLYCEALKKASKHEERGRVLQRLIREFPDSIQAARARGEISVPEGKGMQLFVKGDYAAAAKKLEDELASAKPDDKPSVLWHIARSHQLAGSAENATKWFDRVIAEHPSTPWAADAEFGLASLALTAGQFDPALSHFEKGAAVDDGSSLGMPVATELLARLYPEFVEKSKQISRWNSLREILCYMWKRSDKAQRLEIEKKLDVLNVQLIFSANTAVTESEFYEIKNRDTLGILAKKFDTRDRLIRRINGIKGDMIRAGDRLKILKGRATIVVSKSDLKLTLLFADKYIRSYTVGIGKENGESDTPVGVFKITTMDEDPIWYRNGEKIPPEDERNILGTRWLGLDIPHYGIHGTRDPESVGKRSSAGCIRMRNSEVEEVYDFVREGDTVIIED